jgi:hypothetical protein
MPRRELTFGKAIFHPSACFFSAAASHSSVVLCGVCASSILQAYRRGLKARGAGERRREEGTRPRQGRRSSRAVPTRSRCLNAHRTCSCRSMALLRLILTLHKCSKGREVESPSAASLRFPQSFFTVLRASTTVPEIRASMKCVRGSAHRGWRSTPARCRGANASNSRKSRRSAQEAAVLYECKAKMTDKIFAWH